MAKGTKDKSTGSQVPEFPIFPVVGMLQKSFSWCRAAICQRFVLGNLQLGPRWASGSENPSQLRPAQIEPPVPYFVLANQVVKDCLQQKYLLLLSNTSLIESGLY